MSRNKKKIIRSVTVSMSCVFFEDVMRRLRADGYEMVAVTSPGPELEKLRKEGFHCIEVPMERYISLLKDLKSLWNMIKVFKKEKPYMVHSMTPKAGLICMMAGWLTGVPVRVHTFTGLVWPTSTGLKRKILMATDWLTCACATHVIPEGQGVLNDLKNGGITKKPLKVLGYGNVMGVDMERFDPKRFASDLNTNDRKLTANLSVNSSELGTNTNFTNDTNNEKLILENSRVIDDNLRSKEKIDSENCALHPSDSLSSRDWSSTSLCDSCSKDKPFTFVFVGRIVGDKGINELVEAFTQLHEKYENTKLVLVGPFEKELDPVSELTANRIEENPAITAVGSKRGDDLLMEYAKADCFVMPSYREGFPNTPMEAGAMGLPNIVTDINGSREIVGNLNANPNPNVNLNVNGIKICDNGIIVPPRTVQPLYEAMKRMLTDDAMREKMKQNARPMIQTRFEKSFVQNCLIKFYKEIM